jgi:hypothetical protein
MTAKDERAEKKEITCFICHKTEHEGVLLSCRKGGAGPLGMYPLPSYVDPWGIDEIVRSSGFRVRSKLIKSPNYELITPN